MFSATAEGAETGTAACTQTIEPSARADQIVRVAECHEKAGHLLKAVELYQAAQRKLPSRKMAKRIQERLQVVLAQFATLRIDPSGLPSGARARAGEQTVDVGGPQRVEPGRIVIEVEAEGFQQVTQSVDLLPGEDRVVSLVMLPQSPPAPTPAPVSTPLRSSGSEGVQTTLGYVGIGVGGVGLATGAVFGVLTLKSASAVREGCPTTTTCSPEGASAARAGSIFGTLSTAAVAIGAACLAGGITLLVLRSDKGRTMRAQAADGIINFSGEF